MCFSFRIFQSQMSLLYWVGCKKQNMHSQTWTKFLRFLRVFMYFENKFCQKETWIYQLNLLDLSVVLILKEKPIRFQKAARVIHATSCLCTDGKLCYASIMFCPKLLLKNGKTIIKMRIKHFWNWSDNNWLWKLKTQLQVS